MNEIQQIYEILQKEFSTAQIRLDTPLNQDGVWFLDVFLPDYHLAIAWKKNRGFGLVSELGSVFVSHGYGEGADEVYADLETVIPRIQQLITYKLPTIKPKNL